VSKGKAKKLALVAVAHKLLRQAYGVLKSRRPFDENFCTKTVPKNQNCHSEQSEESHIFLFKSKNQKRDPLDFVLRMTRKCKLTKILEHPYFCT
jgi:hypothetical protein